MFRRDFQPFDFSIGHVCHYRLIGLAGVHMDGGPVDGGPVDGLVIAVDGGPVDGGPVDGGPVDGGSGDIVAVQVIAAVHGIGAVHSTAPVL